MGRKGSTKSLIYICHYPLTPVWHVKAANTTLHFFDRTQASGGGNAEAQNGILQYHDVISSPVTQIRCHWML